MPACEKVFYHLDSLTYHHLAIHCRQDKNGIQVIRLLENIKRRLIYTFHSSIYKWGNLDLWQDSQCFIVVKQVIITAYLDIDTNGYSKHTNIHWHHSAVLMWSIHASLNIEAVSNMCCNKYNSGYIDCKKYHLN